ncbi:winged helix-turn-helix domain-containing protein [Arthrobacter sp. UYP6]|uniref:FadR/GntR family transcriptional regulator n=1 Tax=Arthrobacter sp. UYP6 TaxID=1756378 RepID=UPI00339B1714
MCPHLTSDLAGVLRAEIVEGRIAPGDRLPSESTLISRHGVSRTVVRQAVARLQERVEPSITVWPKPPEIPTSPTPCRIWGRP